VDFERAGEAGEPGSVFTLSIVRACERSYTIWVNQDRWLLSTRATGEEVESHEEKCTPVSDEVAIGTQDGDSVE
jgi:hypothetical protein